MFSTSVQERVRNCRCGTVVVLLSLRKNILPFTVKLANGIFFATKSLALGERWQVYLTERAMSVGGSVCIIKS